MSKGKALAAMIGILAVVSVSGCFDSVMFSDADERFAKSVGGHSSDTYTFNVPQGTDRLEIKYHFAGGGVISVILTEPGGATAKTSQFSGGQADSGTFYTVENPTQGTWTLKVEVSGGASYTFGIYYK